MDQAAHKPHGDMSRKKDELQGNFATQIRLFLLIPLNLSIPQPIFQRPWHFFR